MDDRTTPDLFPPTFEAADAAPPAPGLPPSVADRAASDRESMDVNTPAGVGEGLAEEMTYASRFPPDHPGLQLERPEARSLRRGPIVAVVTALGLALVTAVVVAFSPKNEQTHAANTSSDNEQPKNITVSDKVQNAPANNSEIQPAAPPKLGPPLHGADLPNARSSERPAAGAGGGGVGRSALRQTMREAREKAFGSSILADLEGSSDMTSSSPAAAASALLNASPAVGKAEPPASAPLVGGAGTGDPNMQQHKTDFLARDGVNMNTYLNEPLVLPRSPFELKAGTIIPASLLTAINSDLPGQIIAQVRENVYDTVTGNYLLIPRGSKLLATYDSAVSYGQERVLFCWNRVIRPDGVSISLECMPGADLAGTSGATDEVDHHWWRIITGVALGTLLSATADRAAGNVTGYQPTVTQSWAANAGGAINTAGQQITQKNLAIQPTITIRAGYSVNVIVTKDIVFPPYQRPAGP